MNDKVYLEMCSDSPEFMTIQNITKDMTDYVILGSNDAFVIMTSSMLTNVKAKLNKLDELLNYMDDNNCESWFAKAFWITDGNIYDTTTHEWSVYTNKCLDGFGLVSDLPVFYKACIYVQHEVPIVIPYTGLYREMQGFAKASDKGMKNYVEITNADIY